MFGLMKNTIKENTAPVDALLINELYAGCVVGFGFMPQKSLSGKRLPVEQINSYLFNSDNFLAYRLENETADINLIVADQEDPEGTYLALSQRIDPRLFVGLFDDYDPEEWFALEEGETVNAVPQVLGALQGWITPHYTLALRATGRLLDGDFRLRKATDLKRLSKPFDYVLLVDDDNEYALEAEKYEDGTIHVFATIYRPATDIGEIKRPPKSSSSSSMTNPEAESMPLSLSVEKIVHVRPTEAASGNTKNDIGIVVAGAPEPVLPKSDPNKANVEVAPEVIAAVLSELAADKAGAKAKDDIESKPSSATQIEVKKGEAASAPEVEKKPALSSAMVLPETVHMHGKFGRIQTTNTDGYLSSADILTCDLQLAGRLINEAQRTKMPLSELIRKVIDLPAQVNDQVFIPFSLQSAEAAELARRYNLPNSDIDSIKNHIVEELKRFVGDKK